MGGRANKKTTTRVKMNKNNNVTRYKNIITSYCINSTHFFLHTLLVRWLTRVTPPCLKVFESKAQLHLLCVRKVLSVDNILFQEYSEKKQKKIPVNNKMNDRPNEELKKKGRGTRQEKNFCSLKKYP